MHSPFSSESTARDLPWLNWSLSASFQLVFSENCSTCGCIFEVFMGVVVSSVFLLLCHCDHLLNYYFSEYSFCPLFFLLSLWYSHYVCVGMFYGIPQVS